MGKFNEYLINEDRNYLGQKVAQVLSDVQSLQNDMENLGSRRLSQHMQEIVDEIRTILHSRWNPKHLNRLQDLQAIAVAIQKAISEKGDVKSLLPMVAKSMETLSGKMGVKVNNLEAPDIGDQSNISPQDFQSTGQQPDFKKKPSPAPQAMDMTQPPPDASGQPQSMAGGSGGLDAGASPLGIPDINI